MNAAQAGPRPRRLSGTAPLPRGEGPWPHSRWWLLIALVFAAHLGLIFAFGDRQPIVPRRPSGVLTLQLQTERDELLALSDPTLFAGPHRRGFAGLAWLQIPPVPFRAFEWIEPSTNWLELPAEQLGALFARFMETNSFAGFQLEAKPPPELTVPALALEPAVAARSAFRVEGDLAQRRVLNPPAELPPWTNADLVAPSKVQVLVDAAGNVVSAALLPSDNPLEAAGHSGGADQFALRLAKASRFEPAARDGADTAPNPAAGLRWGTMVFEWQTVPPAATNAPAATQ